MKNKIKIFILAILMTVFFIIPVSSQDSLEARMELIEASQNLQQRREQNSASSQRFRFGVSLSNFGSADTMVNPGLRLENKLTDSGRLKLISELYYLREDEELASFLSLAVKPASFGYLGLGAELSGRANYQLFAGLNLTDNIFVELKGVNDDSDLEDTELYFATGFMIGF